MDFLIVHIRRSTFDFTESSERMRMRMRSYKHGLLHLKLEVGRNQFRTSQRTHKRTQLTRLRFGDGVVPLAPEREMGLSVALTNAAVDVNVDVVLGVHRERQPGHILDLMRSWVGKLCKVRPQHHREFGHVRVQRIAEGLDHHRVCAVQLLQKRCFVHEGKTEDEGDLHAVVDG